MIVLGCDPGTTNYAWAVLNVRERGNRLVLNIKSAGQLHWTITNLTDKPQKPKKSKIKKKIPIKEQMIPPMEIQMRRFKKDWSEQLDKYKPDTFYAERFMTRGLKGATVEAVSMMNGILASLSDDRGMKFAVTTAASWKYHVNTIYDLEELYKKFKGILPNHIIDASFIALYAALKAYNIPWTKMTVDALLDELDRLEY